MNALKDRKIDAFFWVGGLPTAAVTDLGATPGVKIKMIDHSEVVDKMNAKYGNLYITDVIPAKTYPGQDTDNKISTVQNILITNDKMSDDTAYAIVKLIFDKKADLVAVHKEAENFDYKYQRTDNSPVPVASGRGEVLRRQGREDVSLAGTAARKPSSMVVAARGGSSILRESLAPGPAVFFTLCQDLGASRAEILTNLGLRRVRPYLLMVRGSPVASRIFTANRCSART